MSTFPCCKQRFSGGAVRGWRIARAGFLLGGLALASLPPVSAADLANGQRLYVAHCAGCHGVDGVSVLPETPSLAQTEVLAKPDADLIEVVSSGRNMMPPYFGILDDREINDVTSYLRTLR